MCSFAPLDQVPQGMLQPPRALSQGPQGQAADGAVAAERAACVDAAAVGPGEEAPGAGRANAQPGGDGEGPV